MNTLPTAGLEALQQQCRTLHLTTVAQVLDLDWWPDAP